MEEAKGMSQKEVGRWKGKMERKVYAQTLPHFTRRTPLSTTGQRQPLYCIVFQSMNGQWVCLSHQRCPAFRPNILGLSNALGIRQATRVSLARKNVQRFVSAPVVPARRHPPPLDLSPASPIHIIHVNRPI